MSLSPFLHWELLGSLKRLSAEGTFLGLQRILLKKEETLYWSAGQQVPPAEDVSRDVL